MAIDISQYDYAILQRVEEIMRDDLPAIIAEINVELDDASPDPPVLIVATPDESQLAAREDARLDERVLPQEFNGVWARITSSTEILGVGSVDGVGQSRTKHRLELITFCKGQEYERDSPHPEVFTSGYKACLLLARAASVALVRNIKCTAGVYNIWRVPGNRVPTPLKHLPTVHQVRDFFDIWQTTGR